MVAKKSIPYLKIAAGLLFIVCLVMVSNFTVFTPLTAPKHISVTDTVRKQNNPKVEKTNAAIEQNKPIVGKKTNEAFDKNISKVENKRIIVVYTTLYGARVWHLFPLPAYRNPENLHEGCEFQNCVISYDRTLIHRADLLIFHARSMPPLTTLQAMNQRRPPHQRWLYFINESPVNTPNPKPLNGLFHVTMTFKRGSDLYMPNGRYELLKPADKRPDPNINYAANKTGQVAWFVSNCHNARDNIARKLEKYGVNVTVGGGCGRNFPHRFKTGNEKELNKYKFYFSAENSFCTDYITEKYWNTAERQNLVPIVFGGANYSELAVPGSYIDVSKFKSMKGLSDYIKEIDKDDEKYKSFFKWRQKYKVKNRSQVLATISCDICRLLNDKTFKMKYYDLSNFYGVQQNCKVPENIKALLKE